MALEQVWLVLNGKAAGDEAMREAVGTLRGQGHPLQVRVTWEHGDASRYVDEAIAHGAQAVVAAGGDGTVSEVAAALAQRDEPADRLPALAVLPLGTANDLATAAELPRAPLDALRALDQYPAVPVDLLRVEANGQARWCVNLASGGFGTEVTVETAEGLKSMLGGLAYVITGIAKLGRIDTVQARFEGPGFSWNGSFIALGIGNGRQAGGGQVLCPDARLDDGLLDLTIVPELSGEVKATLGALVGGGKEAALERIAVRAQMRSLHIEGDDPLTLNLDGEPLQSRRFDISCVPGRIRMHLPAGCPLLA